MSRERELLQECFDAYVGIYSDLISERLEDFLAEPQGEPEYVWRVRVESPKHFSYHSNAFRSLYGAQACVHEYEEEFANHQLPMKATIDRAQVGTWETCE